MKGLLFKEYKMFKPQLLISGGVVLFLAAVSVCTGSIGSMTGGIVALGIVGGQTQFSLDNQYHCNEYIPVFPVSRREIVLARYLFILILDLIITAATCLLGSILSPFIKNTSLQEIWITCMALIQITILLQMTMIPAIYWFNEFYGRMVLLGIYVLLMFGLWYFLSPRMGGQSLIQVTDIESRWPAVMTGLFAADLAALPLSFWLSLTGYEKRDL